MTSPLGLLLIWALAQDQSLLAKLEQEWTAVARKARASVVELRADGRRFSGVVVGAEGHVLTDASGVAQAKDVMVVLSDRPEPLRAVETRADRLTGLAVVKVEARGLTPLPFAPRQPEAGAPVLLCGNPFSIGPSVVHGTVSATGRSVTRGPGSRPLEDLLQLAAPAFPGDGGALVADVRGEIAGLVIAGAGDPRRPALAAAICYAVPADVAAFVARRLIDKGAVERGFLGIVGRDASETLRQQLAFDGGVVVEEVDPAGPAGADRVKQHDILLRLNGGRIGDLHALRMAVWALPEGSKATLRVVRQRQPIEVELIVGKMP
jgi:S1-C subfamily serine protease